MYSKTKQATDSGKDAVISDIYICDVCGYTTEGNAPDKCPLCNAPRDRFKNF